MQTFDENDSVSYQMAYHNRHFRPYDLPPSYSEATNLTAQLPR